jgi:uncharacterized membrane protein YdjX (TVP38/TMEM64 family)
VGGDEPTSAGAEAEAERQQRARLVRLAIFGLLLLALIILPYATGIGSQLSSTKIRELAQQSGPTGVLLFIGAFAAGELLHVPGMVFIAAGAMVWGRLEGAIFSYLAALVSVSISFAVARLVGGQPFATLRHPRLRALMGHLDRRPITTIATLRLVLWVAPPLNYALALSQVRFADYFVGSALGLVLPVSVMTALFGVLFH